MDFEGRGPGEGVLVGVTRETKKRSGPTPRELRSGLAAGEWTATDPRVYRRPPEPPPEWPAWRQNRLRAANRAGLLFLAGKEWREIGRMLEKEGWLEIERDGQRGDLISRQRVAQYIKKSIEFLLQRGCFEPVARPK